MYASTCRVAGRARHTRQPLADPPAVAGIRETGRDGWPTPTFSRGRGSARVDSNLAKMHALLHRRHSKGLGVDESPIVLRSSAERALWAMAPPTPFDFPSEISEPMPIIGVRH